MLCPLTEPSSVPVSGKAVKGFFGLVGTVDRECLH